MNAAKQNSNNQIVKRIDDFIPLLMERYKVPGLAVSLVTDYENRWIKCYGFSDRALLKPVRRDTSFQVASISKSFTAWGILKLFEQKIIDLDAPITNYIDKWKPYSSEFNIKDITIRRLLSHTAGLSIGGYMGTHPKRPIPTLADSLSKKTIKFIAQPGSIFRYSGGGYTVLQLLIEEVTRTAFSKFMKDNILEPLNMMKSDFTLDSEINKTLSSAYDMFGRRVENYIFAEKAAAGLYSNIDDLTEFLIANMNYANSEKDIENVLTKESISLMHTKVGRAIPYGLGYYVLNMPKSTKVIMSSGDNFGWHSKMVFIPKTGNGIIIMSNSNMGINISSELIRIWSDCFIEGITDAGKRLLNLVEYSKFQMLLQFIKHLK